MSWSVWGIYVACAVAIDLMMGTGLKSLRQNHLIICRTAWKIWFIWTIVAYFSYPILIFFYEGAAHAAVSFVWQIFLNLLLFRLDPQQDGFTVLGSYLTMKAHADHEEDCEFGPKRKFSFKVPTLTWQKFAIRPAFSPA